eukprot:7561453-Pyramimonas_sp.AAC.1
MGTQPVLRNLVTHCSPACAGDRRGKAVKHRVESVTIRSASARSLRIRIARERNLRQAELTLYQWISPGVFERISDVGDLTL